jgi:glucose-6-phosphate isomerase
MEINTRYVDKFIDGKELKEIKKEIATAHTMLEKGTGEGSAFLGWLHLPSSTDSKTLAEIKETASAIRRRCDVFLVIGIGGSYLGSRAAIEFLFPLYRLSKPAIYFAGNNLDPVYHRNLIDLIKDKEIVVNVISKSGTTTEPAIAFRIIDKLMEEKYSKAELKERIIFTTTKEKGALWDIAKKRGYHCFYIPENIGGRFSALTAVGLLPMAVAGADIAEVIKGAADIESMSEDCNINSNIAYKYAGLRSLLYRRGKRIEILASFYTQLYHVLEWWKQIFAESEGKDAKGIFPATAVYSTDLHSIGQLVQEGQRNIFETFLDVKKLDCDINIPYLEDDTDKLNYLHNKGIDFVNRMAYEGTALAHMEGYIPNMTVTIDERSAYCIGQLYYFMQRAVAISGYLLKVNPFDQPGVEAYKHNMFKLLRKA